MHRRSHLLSIISAAAMAVTLLHCAQEDEPNPVTPQPETPMTIAAGDSLSSSSELDGYVHRIKFTADSFTLSMVTSFGLGLIETGTWQQSSDKDSLTLTPAVDYVFAGPPPATVVAARAAFSGRVGATKVTFTSYRKIGATTDLGQAIFQK